METPGQGVFDLAESDIDSLPFGLIAVDEYGTIEQYNAYESKLARLPKDRVIGRNFFRFVAGTGDAAESFDFEFRFAFGRQFVNITFVRSVKNRQIKILVNRYDDP
jgi:photoactive yellow protein